MYGNAMKRLIILISFLVAIICLLANLLRGSDLLYSAFMSLCLMFTTAIILFYVIRSIAYILFSYLEKQAKTKEEQENKAAQTNEQ